MKKRLAVMILTGAMMVGISACGNKETADLTTQEQTAEVSEESTEDTSSESSATEQKVSDREDYVAIEDLAIKDYVTLSDYKNMTVQVERLAVTDDSIKAYINENMLTSYPIMDRAVANGDTVTIDFVGKRDDVAFEGGTAEDYQLTIGSGYFIDGFEEGLIGVTPGETVDLNLTFPDDYTNAEMAGAEVVFTVTVDNILATTNYDDVTLEQLSQMGLSYETKEAMWEEAKKEVEEQAEQSYEASVVNAIIENLLAGSTFSAIPENYVDEEIQNYNNYMENISMSYYGMDLESFITSYYGMSIEDYNEQLKPMAEETVKQYLVVEAISQEEGLSVTEEEVMEKARQEAADYQYESVDSMLSDIGYTTYRMYIVQDAVMEKLRDMVTIEEVDGAALES